MGSAILIIGGIDRISPVSRPEGYGILRYKARSASSAKDIPNRESLRPVEYDEKAQHAQQMQAIGQLASGISHEINTPTQYIGDNVTFLRESFGGLTRLLDAYENLRDKSINGGVDEAMLRRIADLRSEIDIQFLVDEIPSAIDRTLEGNRRVAEVVRSMKEFAHPSAKEMSPTDINHSVKGAAALSRNEWKYIAELVLKLDRTIPRIPCITGAINQVLLNLIVNAAHAIQEVVGDGATDKGTITIATKRLGDWAEIRVSDTGTGITEADRTRIYDPFFTTKGIGQGTGQGLALSHSVVVKTHGGQLDLETEVGKGTTFILRLPLDRKPG
jgi:signal transduction histidine kinase